MQNSFVKRNISNIYIVCKCKEYNYIHKSHFNVMKESQLKKMNVKHMFMRYLLDFKQKNFKIQLNDKKTT